MAANAKIDFDYLGYSLLRLEGYHYMKQSCLLAVKPLIEARILTRGPPVHYGLVGWGAAATVFHLPIIAASTGGLVSGAVVRDEAVRSIIWLYLSLYVNDGYLSCSLLLFSIISSFIRHRPPSYFFFTSLPDLLLW